MRISRTPNATPHSTPPSSAGSRGEVDVSAGDEQLIWRSLVPRLVHPVRLQIVEALIERGSPMSAEELAPAVSLADGNVDLVRYHVGAMAKAGVLEVAGADRAQGKEEPGDLPFFFVQPK